MSSFMSESSESTLAFCHREFKQTRYFAVSPDHPVISGSVSSPHLNKSWALLFLAMIEQFSLSNTSAQPYPHLPLTFMSQSSRYEQFAGGYEWSVMSNTSNILKASSLPWPRTHPSSHAPLTPTAPLQPHPAPEPLV